MPNTFTKIVAITFIAILLILVGGQDNPSIVIAQQATTIWSEPIQLSDPNYKSGAPAVASDPAGNVHFMWSEQRITENQFIGEGDTLYYARWDGQNLSFPIDVFVSPCGIGGITEFPELAVTPDGTLHVVWVALCATSKLIYAHAPACCADDARNWSDPITLGLDVQGNSALVADDQGRLHVASATIETKKIVYQRSDDGGKTWPVYEELFAGITQDDEYPMHPRLAVDDLGRVHLVWGIQPWPGRAVLYTRSDDGGNTWNDSQVIDSVDNPAYKSGYAPIFIDIEAHGDNEIHLLWDGAPTVERNHIWSSDGGNTWSDPPNLTFPEIREVGRSGWNDMVVDSLGMMHAVALGGPLYSSWSNGDWSPSTWIARSDCAEWMRLVENLGNQLFAAWVCKIGDTTWYARGVTNAPQLDAAPFPTTRSEEEITPIGEATEISLETTPTHTISIGSENNQLSFSSLLLNPLYLIMIGVIPGVLLVGIYTIYIHMRNVHK